MKLEEIKNKTNEAVSYLVAALESGQSDVLTQYLNAMARFHNYSFGNIMLIARQKPQATNVAGIRTWNQLGRFVKRGEKGILILAPMVGRRAQRSDAIATEIETANAAEERKAAQELYGFRAVYVFDVDQTEGKELPSLSDVRGDVSGYRERQGHLLVTHKLSEPEIRTAGITHAAASAAPAASFSRAMRNL